MSVCKLSQACEDITSTGISTNEVHATTRNMDHPGTGKPSGGSNGLHSQSSSKHMQNSTNLSRQPVHEFRHPGMKYIGAQASASESRPQDVPFAPRPVANLQIAGGTQAPTLPYSSNFLKQPVSAAQPTSANARGITAAMGGGSRMPARTLPLAASAAAAPSSQSAAPNTAGRNSNDTASTIYRSPAKAKPPQNEPKKRSHAVMEVTKMVLPKDFLNKISEKEDVYAELPTLWAKTGDPEEIYATRTFPEAETMWDLTRILPKEPPLPPLPPGTPGSFSGTDSILSPSPKKTGRGVYTRSTFVSVVDEVYSDSRYVGARGKRPKLMPQSSGTQSVYAPLDRAEFRDYRLLPVDFFVVPLECFQLALDDEDQKDESEDERPRRRRRPPPRKEPIVLPSPQVKKRKGKQISKTSVCVGPKCQVDPECLPRPSNGLYKVDPGIYLDPPSSSGEIDEQLWDPKKAAAAEQRGEDIEGFLSAAKDSSSHFLLMHALHQANYSVVDAERKFVLLYKASKEPSALMTLQEIGQANEMFEDSRKEFGKIAAKINRSVATVMMQYYYWKTMEKRNGSGSYERMKKRRKNEEDVCFVCGDGGLLILCDGCHTAHHLECVGLKETPKTDWHCMQCLKSPAKLRAMAPINHAPQRVLDFPSPQYQGRAIGETKEELIDLTED